jgi:hypothetical protein
MFERLVLAAAIGVALLPVVASAEPTPAPAATPAAAATPAGPLRSLVYAVDVGIRTSNESMNLEGSATFGAGTTAKGTIQADVIGLAPGNTLVFRVSEVSDTRKAPPVTVGVLDLGQIRSSPKDAPNLNQEELELLGMLGRGVVADHDLGPGVTWKVEGADTKNPDVTTYTVESLVGDDKVNITFDRTVKVTTAAQPFDVHSTGKMLYDFKRSVPLSASVLQRVHEEGEKTATTDLSFEYKLVSDSMAK